jgi:TPR repeat protein
LHGFAPAQAVLSFFYSQGSPDFPKNLPLATSLAEASAKQGDMDGVAMSAVLKLAASSAKRHDMTAKQMADGLRTYFGQVKTSAIGGSVYGEFLFARAIDAFHNAPLSDSTSYAFALLARERGLSDDELVASLEKHLNSERAAKADEFVGEVFDVGQLGVPKDEAEALKWYRKGADLGNADAQLGLGDLYRWGRGVPRDYEQALTWFKRAAAHGNGDAENTIGVMYMGGEGVAVDYSEALAWLRKAQNHGVALAGKNIETIMRAQSAQLKSGSSTYARAYGETERPWMDIGPGLGAAAAAEMWNSGEPSGNSDEE